MPWLLSLPAGRSSIGSIENVGAEPNGPPTYGELWRTAFARLEQTQYSALLVFGWCASRSSGVSRAKAGGEGSSEPEVEIVSGVHKSAFFLQLVRRTSDHI